MTDRIWILGAPDPEMAAIESLLRECGETVAYAVAGVDRVHAENAVLAERAHYPAAFDDEQRDPQSMGHEAYPQTGRREYWVECDGLAARRRAANDPATSLDVARIDHHRPGDPGYGRPPSEFFVASSLGQVIAALARLGRLPPSWLTTFDPSDGRPAVGGRIPADLVLTAAADHCLGAAYRGECPGVDPDALLRWRVESRARFQARSVESLLESIEAARGELETAWMGGYCPSCGGEGTKWEYQCDECVGRGVLPSRRLRLADGVDVADMRRPMSELPLAELPEAAARAGIGYVSGPLAQPDGRRKITCSGSADQVRAFLEHWAPAQGLVDCYGDPARGFAGGYLS